MSAPIRAASVAPLVAALLLAGCAAGDGAADGSSESPTAGESQSAGPEPTGSETPVALPDPVDLPEGTAATVGDVDVTDDEVDERVALQGRGGTPDDADAQRQVLSQLVQVELVRQAAERELGIDVVAEIDGPAVAAKKAELIDAAGGPEAFITSATAQGISAADADGLIEADAEIQLLVDLISDALVVELPDDAVDEDGLRADFEEDPSQYESSDVAHILVEEEGTAEEALDRIDDGEEFGDVARDVSTGPSGPDGGELGVAPRGSYVDEFSAAVYADDVEPGDVVGPVETEFGYHVIKINEIITPPFEDVLADAREAAVAATLQTFFADSFGAVDVVVDEQYGVWDSSGPGVVAV